MGVCHPNEQQTGAFEVAFQEREKQRKEFVEGCYRLQWRDACDDGGGGAPHFDEKKKMMERRRFLQEQAINSAMYYILEKSDTGAWGTTGIIGYLYIVV